MVKTRFIALPNVPSHRLRAAGTRVGTETSSRGSVQTVCSASLLPFRAFWRGSGESLLIPAAKIYPRDVGELEPPWAGPFGVTVETINREGRLGHGE